MANDQPQPKPMEIPSTNTSHYDLNVILDKKKKTKKPQSHIQDLQAKIKTIKLKLHQLKEKQREDSKKSNCYLQTKNLASKKRNYQMKTLP